MMRMLLVIAALGGIAVGLVQLRRAETAVRHDIQRRRLREVTLRRTLWDQQMRLSRSTAPEEVRRRARRMALDLRDAEPAPRYAGLSHVAAPNVE